VRVDATDTARVPLCRAIDEDKDAEAAGEPKT
jgi:hypothetical protein